MKQSRFGVLCVATLLVAVMLILSCGQPSSPSTDFVQTDWKLVSHHPTTLPAIGDGMMVFAERVNAASGGRLNLSTFPGGQLYKERAVYDAVGDGLVQAATHAVAYGDETIPVCDMFHIPFLYTDLDKLRQAFHGEFGRRLAEEARACINIVPVYYDWVGIQKMCNNARPVERLADLQGLKIRTTGTGDAAIVAAFGGSPVSMASSELYAALQRGVVDGAFTSLIQSYKFEEVQKYLSWVPFAVVPAWTFVNGDLWDSMPPDLQQLVKDIGSQLEEERTAAAHVEQLEELAYLQQHMQVFVPTSVEMEEWAAACESVHEEYYQRRPLARELHDLYLAQQ